MNLKKILKSIGIADCDGYIYSYVDYHKEQHIEHRVIIEVELKRIDHFINFEIRFLKNKKELTIFSALINQNDNRASAFIHRYYAKKIVDDIPFSFYQYQSGYEFSGVSNVCSVLEDLIDILGLKYPCNVRNLNHIQDGYAIIDFIFRLHQNCLKITEENVIQYINFFSKHELSSYVSDLKKHKVFMLNELFDIPINDICTVNSTIFKYFSK